MVRRILTPWTCPGFVRRIARWVVPLLLIALGLLLLGDGMFLYADGVRNLSLQNYARCNQSNATVPHSCPFLESNGEMAYAILTGFLGACTLTGGIAMGVVRKTTLQRSRNEG